MGVVYSRDEMLCILRDVMYHGIVEWLVNPETIIIELSINPGGVSELCSFLES